MVEAPSWEKHKFYFAEKYGVLNMGSTLTNEEQYFAIFSTRFSVQLCQANLKYFGDHPRICISLIFCSLSLGTFGYNMDLYFPTTRVSRGHKMSSSCCSVVHALLKLEGGEPRITSNIRNSTIQILKSSTGRYNWIGTNRRVAGKADKVDLQ
jgi:hypothetical protein